MTDKPSAQSKSAQSAATDQPDPDEAPFAAFEPYLSDYGTTERVLQAARSFSFPVEDFSVPANSPGAEVFVIGERELLLGFASVGLEVRGEESSAAWLVEWLEAKSVDVAGVVREHSPSLSDLARIAPEIPVVPSEQVENLLMVAADLADRTVGRDRANARHLLYVLLDGERDNSFPFGDHLDADGIRDFKQNFLDRLERSHEETENLAEWRRLISGPKPAEAVGTLSDAPALVDALGRQAFAEVLATRVKQVSETLRSGTLGNDAAFILHVDGPWGSGKTSILNFLKEDLEKSDPPWVIVEFNAWRNQQRSPAWWPIISHVWGAVRRESPFKFKLARWVWLKWNMRIRWLPVALSIVLTGVLLYFAWQAVSGQTTGVVGAVKDIGAAVLALVTLAGLALTTSRSVFFGSRNAAETYVQSTVEPYRPIVRLFERLIDAIEQPVAVFIDDIDRCDSGYVIELLEGIQTLLRSAPVVYIVAGDRKWICSSFEKRYSDFGGQIGMPGRPLGYLFLDKVFQLSTAIPRLSHVRQAAYWKRLLESGEHGAAKTSEDLRKLEADAESELVGKSTHEEIQQQIDESKDDSLHQEALRAAAAKQTTSREAIRAAEHRLQPLAHLLEPNPRSMKRLVNAYGLNQARVFLEGRKVEVEALARWTIVELRWPILADFLATNWTDIAAGNLSFAQFPDDIRALLADLDVREVFGVIDQPGLAPSEGRSAPVKLTVESLGPILG